MLLARKVLVAKWVEAQAELDAPVPADPLGDLRTDNNELSVWEVADDLADLDDLIAAMASVFESLSSCDVALVSEDSVLSRGIGWRSSRGHTRIARAEARHRDLHSLTGVDLVSIAEVFRRGSFHMFEDREVAVRLAAAVNRRDLDVDVLSKKWKALVAPLLLPSAGGA
jgi:hypothetical protein